MNGKNGLHPEPCAFVIFGASGDLTKRKLVPALYNLAAEGWLPDPFAILGLAVDKLTTESYRAGLGEDIEGFLGAKPDPAIWKNLASRIEYAQGDFKDPAVGQELAQTLKAKGFKNAVFYFAVPPSLIGPIAENLSQAGLVEESQGFRRVVVEKPFGRDLASAKALNAELLKIFQESQIYRIDHYLGKETVQNLMALRFANGIFEPLWNQRYVDHVQITVAEELGVEHRGGYYEQAGALRDMIVNHLFQLLTLTAMEPPVSFSADAVRGEQVKVLSAIRSFAEEGADKRCVRGQYGPGALNGAAVPGYRREPMVAPDSATETFVALKVFIDSWRWSGVPFYLRTGKRLARRAAEICVEFKAPPMLLFQKAGVDFLSPNRLVIRIQPSEGASLSFGAKVPGPAMEIGEVNMNFRYEDYFGKKLVTGYERLLHDVLIGDATLFKRADMVEAGWSAVDPILERWAGEKPRFPNYNAGTWGPREADELLARDGRAWRECGESPAE
ncbi:MAG TPA: glucose-6-phosphate dehydrogenase [Elusimicrobiota bacterium]|nr:glucose-6-phosphate dehydrogenase [Elusimicrobiota bacterium]